MPAGAQGFPERESKDSQTWAHTLTQTQTPGTGVFCPWDSQGSSTQSGGLWETGVRPEQPHKTLSEMGEPHSWLTEFKYQKLKGLNLVSFSLVCQWCLLDFLLFQGLEIGVGQRKKWEKRRGSLWRCSFYCMQWGVEDWVCRPLHPLPPVDDDGDDDDVE